MKVTHISRDTLFFFDDYSYNHSFETRLEPAGRTGNRWVDWLEHTFGSAMQLAQRESVKLGSSLSFFFAFNLNHILKNGTDGS